jgi:hypothetical protein
VPLQAECDGSPQQDRLWLTNDRHDVTSARAKLLETRNVSGLLVRIHAHNSVVTEHDPLPSVQWEKLRDLDTKTRGLVLDAREDRVAIQYRGLIRVHGAKIYTAAIIRSTVLDHLWGEILNKILAHDV